MPRTWVHADAELVAIDWLRAGLPDVTVSDESQGTLPEVVVSRFGGTTQAAGNRDRAHLDFDVYAATKQDARDYAAQALARMLESRYANHPGAVVLRVRDIAGLAWLPDPVRNDRPRYRFSVELTTRPKE